MSVAFNSLSDKAWKRLVNEGATKAGAAGFLGNVFAESGMQSAICEYLCIQRLRENGKNYTQETYYKAIDSGKISKAEFLNPLPNKVYGFGWCQWTSTGRKSGLYDRTVAVGKSIADEDVQIDYAFYDLKNIYQSVWKVLTTTNSVKVASDAVLKDFESPNNWSSLSSERNGYSQEYYNHYTTTATTTKGSDVMAEFEITGGNYISNSGSDENGRATGGKAGDQTGNEWTIRGWYNRPWNCVLRYPDTTVANKISELAIKAARNDKIGYNQNNRTSYWLLLRSAGYDPSKITTACDADCSAGVIANVKAVGYLLGIPKLQNIWATYTGNMRQAFYEAGFQILSGNKFLTSPDYLLPGDILLNDVHHTATCVSRGSKAAATSSSNTTQTSSTTINTTSGKWTGVVQADTKVRTWAGEEYKEVSFSPVKKGAEIEVQYSLKAVNGSEWYYFKASNNLYAFIPASAVEAKIQASGGKQYRVQVGAFSKSSGAEVMVAQLEEKGFEGMVIKSGNLYMAQAGMFNDLANAEKLRRKLETAGFEVAVIPL